MRTTFLFDVAEYYLNNFSDDKHAVCLVFPNRRAGTFFKRELLRIKPGAQWVPKILSTEDFVRDLTRFRQIDAVSALFEFYSIYKETEKESADAFDVFSTWATQLLHDFQEIDLYCVDSKNLFGSIDAAYAMRTWSPDGAELTANQQQYLKFWSRMGRWYNLFREHLLRKNMATSAMAYRFLAENIKTKDIPWDHIIFAGFNALNASEQTIIKSLENRGKATMLWDLDHYYVDPPMSEAGLFARNHLKETGDQKLNFTGNWINDLERKIHITGVAKNIGQVLVAGSIIDTLINENEDLTDTSLVLCDEPLLMPLLEVLPEELGKANITMGYPLHLLPVASLFSILLEMRVRSKIVKHEGKQEIGFYFKDIQRVLRNPVFAGILEKGEADLMIRRLENEREVFMPFSKLLINPNKEASPLAKFEYLFEQWKTASTEGLDALLKLSEAIRSHVKYSANNDNGYELEALFEITSLVNRIRTMLNGFNQFIEIKTLSRVFNQLLKQLTLPFLGEPLDGMQIMGLLETRNLDFKNLILLSVNENILPAAKSHQSFIPFDIALAFGLPTYRERDAVYAYHFYRMIQRAENVWLVYNTESDEFGKGEKSRYITQIIEELKSPKCTITSEIYVPQIPIKHDLEIKVPKDEKLISEIIERFSGKNGKSGLSPTSISSYLKCNLQFYFKNFSNIKTDKLKEEEIGADEIGNVAHKVLEDLYKPYVGRIVSSEAIESMLEDFEPLVDKAFKELSVGRTFEAGKNILVKYGTKRMIIQQLEAELRTIKSLEKENKLLTLISVEEWLTAPIKINSTIGQQEILLKGKVDRIDQIAGELRIIDYKTGAVDTKYLKLSTTTELQLNGEMEKALQLFQYILMASNKYANSSIKSGIMSLKTPSLGIMEVALDGEDIFTHERLPYLKELFIKIVEEIVDPTLNFEQTKDLKTCGYCDFAGICNR